jgi:hypothetical protein
MMGIWGWAGIVILGWLLNLSILSLVKGDSGGYLDDDDFMDNAFRVSCLVPFLPMAFIFLAAVIAGAFGLGEMLYEGCRIVLGKKGSER